MPIKLLKASLMVVLFLCCGACHQKKSEILSVIQDGKDSIHEESVRPAFFSVTGILVIPAGDIVLISPKSSGLLKSVSFPSGSYVRKGEVIAIIENPEFLKLQQQYLEAKSEFFYYGEDLKRQGGLAIENATSVKKCNRHNVITRPVKSGSGPLKSNLYSLALIPTAWMPIT
jgi:membrane fusion protein, heavy metal efflux system